MSDGPGKTAFKGKLMKANGKGKATAKTPKGKGNAIKKDAKKGIMPKMLNGDNEANGGY